MNKKVAIIDYDMGNLRSILNAFEVIGAEPYLINTPEEVVYAKALVLPGVGAFKEGMNKLREKNLIRAILEYEKTNKPFLGICLGLQLLLEESEEFGMSKGIGLIPGKVVALESPKVINIGGYKVPNIGWNKIFKPKDNMNAWDNTILSQIKEGEEVYFVHSFSARPSKRENILAVTFYGDYEICAAIRNNNIMGCQFHPEKSGKEGLKILSSFCKL